MKYAARIYVAGHQGLVGSALVRQLHAAGYHYIVTRTPEALDLRNQAAVNEFFHQERPEYVFLAAAKVGGIYANSTYPAEFIYDNLMIQTNVLHAAYRAGVKKLLFLGSSCIYPRDATSPIQETALLTGSLEKTNEPYALAKLAGLSMCQAYNRQYGTCFVTAIPTNLYGPGDTFHAHNSHVVPALMLKMHEAKLHKRPYVTVWGTGMARRELLYVDDCAQALILLMQAYERNEPINVGTGVDCTILELAHYIQEIIGYAGELRFDARYPDGTLIKLLDISKIRQLGWQPRISLYEGLQRTYHWFLERYGSTDRY